MAKNTSTRNSAEMTHVHADRAADSRTAACDRGSFDGSDRHHFFPRVSSYTLKKVVSVTIFIVAICGLGELSSAPPPEVQSELSQLRVHRITHRVQSLPGSLQTALARLFEQKSLELGNPNDPIGGSVTFTGDPDRFAPYRRLIFAFDTKHFHFIYDEHGDPENSANVLVFAKAQRGEPKFAWGGVDLRRPFAKNPQELRSRILRGNLFDNKDFVW